MGDNNSKTQTDSVSMTSYFPIEELPDDLIVEVFIRVPGRDLAKACTRVCKKWYHLLKTQRLWKEKCLREYNFPCDTLAALSRVLHADFKTIFFHNPYNRNLIENPDATEGFKDWVITNNGGDQFIVEKAPVGCDPVTNFTTHNHKGETVGCWATSYMDCYKHQVIDLIKEGCSREVLDNVRPNINVSEWYAARFDCGIRYNLCVQLLKDLKDKVPLHEFKFEDDKPAGREWFNVQHTFRQYKQGVRYIRYIHGGKDTQFWAGHYGVKVTLSSVRFDLSHTAGPVEH